MPGGRYIGQASGTTQFGKARRAVQRVPSGGATASMDAAAPPHAMETVSFAPAGVLRSSSGEATMMMGAGVRTDLAALPVAQATPRKPLNPWRVARVALGLLGIIMLGAVGYSLFKVWEFQERIYNELPATPTAMAAAMPTQPTAIPGEATPTLIPTSTPDLVRELPVGRFNILVLGTDKRPDEEGVFARSDSLVLVNVDTISRTVRLMSIPRDLIVTIPDYGESKVNAAYFYGEYYGEPGGGPALALRTLSRYFDVAINYYVTVNFEGFRTIVDTVGGININVPYELDDYMYPSDDEGDLYGTIRVHFDAGWQRMDGKTALRYARTRHADNDYARSRRQLQVIMAIRQKAMSLDLLPSAPAILDQLGGMVETNLKVDQQLGLAQLGFGLSASSILTTSIDADLVTPTYLADGSEGLALDWDAAQPMLDDFFGFGTPTPAPSPTRVRRR